MTGADLVRSALTEDLPTGSDATCELFVTANQLGSGHIEARSNCVISGLDVVIEVFRQRDGTIRLQPLVANGSHVSAFQRIMEIEGAAASVLSAERTALNFLGHLSGIASLTREFVKRVQPFGTKILGTRKTTPCLRELEVKAIRDGGGDVYRCDLSSAVLIKDNHAAISGGARAISQLVRNLMDSNPQVCSKLLESGKIEAQSIEDVQVAVESGWKHVLLDNFPPADVHRVVRVYGDRVMLEVSGGVTLENIESYAATGVPLISIGALTHSAKSADFSLEMEWSSK